jgi:hypothetical protein
MKMNENMEAMLEKKAAMAREKINALMQKMETMKERKFNPFPHFTLHNLLSHYAPQYYTEQELAQIEKINQHLRQETKLPLNIPQSTMKGEVVNKKKRCRSSDEGSSMSYAKRRVKPKSTKKMEPKKQDKEKLSSPPPILPIDVEIKIKELNGTDIKHIMCKKLFASDLRDDQNRLLMPLKEVKVDFLTDVEKDVALARKDGNNKPVGLEVIVLDPSFREFRMSLRKWSMGINKYYSLVHGWKAVVSKNSFEKGIKLNIWTFRVNDKLHFVLDNNQVML